MTLSWQSRMELPSLLNSLNLLGNGVEVGVQRGVFSEHIRLGWNGAMLYCVDPWKKYDGVINPQEMHDAYYAEAVGRLRATGKPWTEMRMTSLEAAAHFAKDGTRFDFVFLDGDHFYEAVKADVEAWLPLIRPGGVLAGHDYVPDGWHRNGDAFTAYPDEASAGPHCGPFGVVKAVTELFGAGGKYEREVALTLPSTDEGWRSWAVRA